TTSTDAGATLTSYEPLGGVVEVLDPYPDFTRPVPIPRMIKHDAALATLSDLGGQNQPAIVSYLSSQAPNTLPPPPIGAEVWAQTRANPFSSPTSPVGRIASAQRALPQPGAGSGVFPRMTPPAARVVRAGTR